MDCIGANPSLFMSGLGAGFEYLTSTVSSKTAGKPRFIIDPAE
jgi:hypothetical protein